ncbi:phosphorylase superfamily protein [Mycobacterium kansasii 732]|nr:phosphorylase superfamily protein [Mycobacterium kansasii 732]
MIDGQEGYPLVAPKDFDAPSVFRPANLLREARRQKSLPDKAVPAVCVLDPDGDMVRHLERAGTGYRHAGWACYHTDMWVTRVDGLEIGVVGMAVGAPFAVLVAEQLAASGASLTVSITSAGRISGNETPPYFVLIERALRDEGTSAHYVAPAEWSYLAEELQDKLRNVFDSNGIHVVAGSSWTTDAPYRETALAIKEAERRGIACVEMEAAALYAYAAAAHQKVVCLAHITNTMAVAGDDFEKGADNGVNVSLTVAYAVATAILGSDRPEGS